MVGNATGRPGARAKHGIPHPSGASRIGFEVWLPASGWSGRIHMVGNGAYSSEIRYSLLTDIVSRGDAAVATDTGHKGANLMFGVENPQAIADWGHRAVHESIGAGKRLARAYHGRGPAWAVRALPVALAGTPVDGGPGHSCVRTAISSGKKRCFTTLAR